MTSSLGCAGTKYVTTAANILLGPSVWLQDTDDCKKGIRCENDFPKETETCNVGEVLDASDGTCKPESDVFCMSQPIPGNG